MMRHLKKFEFAFGVGSGKVDHKVVELVHAVAAEIDPFYLVSCDKLVPKDGTQPDPLRDQIQFPERVYERRLMLDSGGYSIYSGARFEGSLRPCWIAWLYNQFPGPLCISPDAPMYHIAIEDSLWANCDRFEEFYCAYKPKTETWVYDAIHGEYEE